MRLRGRPGGLLQLAIWLSAFVGICCALSIDLRDRLIALRYRSIVHLRINRSIAQQSIDVLSFCLIHLAHPNLCFVLGSHLDRLVDDRSVFSAGI